LKKEHIISKVSNLPKVNKDIKALKVRVIDENGQALGILDTREALRMAENKGLDLLEISPNAEPPVCKILNFGKFKYEAKKKANEAKKKQKTVEIKEVKFSPNIGDNDYEVKLKSLQKFIAAGDKAKISLKFKGREIAHKELGLNLLEKIKNEMAEVAKVELPPRFEGKQVIMVLVPK
jgi:translation initiation factor IF-3